MGDQKAACKIACCYAGKNLDDIQDICAEIQRIKRYVKHSRHDMFKAAENKSGDKKPYVKDLTERSLFLLCSDQDRKGYETRTQYSQNKQALRCIIKLCISNRSHSLPDHSLKS